MSRHRALIIPRDKYEQSAFGGAHFIFVYFYGHECMYILISSFVHVCVHRHGVSITSVVAIQFLLGSRRRI